MGSGQGRGQRKIKHFHFGQVTKRSSYGKELIFVNWPIMSGNEYTNWKKLYDKAKQMRKDNLLIPENQQIKPYTGGGAFNCCCCAVDNVVQLTYQNFDYMFSAEIKNRNCNPPKYYNQQQLFYILYNFSEALKQFQINKINFGDIRTKNIAYTKSKQLKMICVASHPSEKNQFKQNFRQFLKQRSLFFRQRYYYQAPEELIFLKTRRGSVVNFQNSKSQAFSLSLILLEAATLQNSQQLYQMPQRTFQNKLHETRLNQVSRKYVKFYSYLKKISTIEQSDRITAGQLWSRLKIYRQYINQMKPFSQNINKEDQQMSKFKADYIKTK